MSEIKMEELAVKGSNASLVSYNENPKCAACGLTSGKGILYRWLKLWHGCGFMKFDVMYCKGSMPPSEGRNVNTMFGTVQAETQHDCYEVFEPHLHVRCRRCGAIWWMKLEGEI